MTWMGLLTALTLGADSGSVRAEVRGEVADGEHLRLIVQTYDAPAHQARAPKNAQPLGSIQRAITADELAHGITLMVPGLTTVRPPLVIAWVETGLPNLEYNGRMSRPGRGSTVGHAHGESVRIELGRSRRITKQAA